MPLAAPQLLLEANSIWVIRAVVVAHSIELTLQQFSFSELGHVIDPLHTMPAALRLTIILQNICHDSHATMCAL